MFLTLSIRVVHVPVEWCAHDVMRTSCYFLPQPGSYLTFRTHSMDLSEKNNWVHLSQCITWPSTFATPKPQPAMRREMCLLAFRLQRIASSIHAGEVTKMHRCTLSGQQQLSCKLEFDSYRFWGWWQVVNGKGCGSWPMLVLYHDHRTDYIGMMLI